MHFATISEYTAYAMEYFIDRFIDDVAPYVVEEQKKRLKDNTHMERMEFASDYSGATTSWQATVPLGLLFQFNSIQNIFHTVLLKNTRNFPKSEYNYIKQEHPPHLHTAQAADTACRCNSANPAYKWYHNAGAGEG